MQRTFGFLGCGRMGGALLAGWLDARRLTPDAVTVADPGTGAGLAADLGVNVGDRAAAGAADVVVLAVKPQYVDAALAGLAFSEEQLVISVVAGLPHGRLVEKVKPARVVRTMPNLGARIGAGVTLVLGQGAPPADVQFADDLFGAVGHAEVLSDEALFHVGTALVGSGPAYLFVAMQAMADGAVAGGMPRDAARRLSAATVQAAGGLAAEPDAHPEALKDAVASPGGTTIAALGILERRGFRGALFDAVLAAAERSKELAR